jgi:hypothetical protein
VGLAAYPLRQNLVASAPLHTVLGKFRLQNALLAEEYRQQGGADPAAGEVMPSREYTGGGAGLLQHQVSFCRYRFCATGELKYRGAVGRRQVHCTLIVKIIRFYC